ncbi:MAG: hypothetical protein ACW99U_12785 [Candidatus Thorarchaeota archaeon]|jgi:hypothetical protein
MMNSRFWSQLEKAPQTEAQLASALGITRKSVRNRLGEIQADITYGMNGRGKSQLVVIEDSFDGNTYFTVRPSTKVNKKSMTYRGVNYKRSKQNYRKHGHYQVALFEA